MGTNFYLRKKLVEKEKEQVKKLLDEDKYEEVVNILPNKIHIGKRSSGWKFLWDVNHFKYYDANKESLFNFLKSGQIIDEYGDEFTFDEFFEKEIASFLDEGEDAKSYSEKYPHDWWFNRREAAAEFMIKHEDQKIYVNKYGEFYIDDFRCTIDVDFS